MIRRLKKDVLDQLPDKRRQMIEIAVDQKKLKEINEVLANMRGQTSYQDEEGPLAAMQKMLSLKSSTA